MHYQKQRRKPSKNTSNAVSKYVGSKTPKVCCLQRCNGDSLTNTNVSRWLGGRNIGGGGGHHHLHPDTLSHGQTVYHLHHPSHHLQHPTSIIIRSAPRDLRAPYLSATTAYPQDHHHPPHSLHSIQNIFMTREETCPAVGRGGVVSEAAVAAKGGVASNLGRKGMKIGFWVPLDSGVILQKSAEYANVTFTKIGRVLRFRLFAFSQYKIVFSVRPSSVRANIIQLNDVQKIRSFLVIAFGLDHALA
ncbi:hypothetical protein LR48_Vigan07g118700 [Vigna angularis]|uniref:Uncharacterized protein n=1 Tax=Phaseolus angularis TaxID=3914 RepID=A0A0L9UXK1_PHAAN|nr:hypothetical protein LR48_Vigan07g118700 [Vigna angularis]